MTDGFSARIAEKVVTLLASIILAAGFLVGKAASAPVEWSLSGVTFNDGGIAFGSFVYDADTNVFSSIALSTIGGGIAGSNYDEVTPLTSAARPYFTTTTGDLTSAQYLYLILDSPLTNAGGAISLSGIFEGVCIDPNCATILSIVTRDSSVGFLTSVNPVPVPPALFLFGTALAGMAGYNRLKRRRASIEA